MMSPANVLLVDDEPRNLEVLESILGSADYRLVRVQSAEAALLELVQSEFACIVLDVQMPGMNGFELARLIKTRKRSQHIPMVFITAYFQEDKDILEGYGAGAVDYLTKPVNPNVLRSKVEVFVKLYRATKALAETNAALELEMFQRRKAEDSLRQSNVDLETRVRERTAALSRANQELRASEERYRLLLENALEYAIFTLDCEGRVATWNAGAQRLLGHEEREILGQRLDVIFSAHDRDQGQLSREIETASADGKAESEGWRLRKDGSRLWGTGLMMALKDEEGRPLGFLKIVRDRTARKQAEDALRESEQRYRHLIRSLPAALYTTDAQGRVTIYNDAAAALWGREPEPGRDRWCGSHRIFRPDGAPLPHEECPMAVTLRQGRPVRGQEIVIERPDGSLRHALSHPEPIYDIAGSLIGAVNMLVDITETRRAGEALRESEERFRTMANAAPVLVWMSGPDSLRTYFNQPWLDFTGRKLEQETGDGWAESVHPEDRPRCLRVCRQSAERRQPFEMEYRLRRADAMYRWITDHGAPRFTTDGTFVGFIGGCIDITLRREAEDVMRRSRDELDARVRERTAELARANDELRSQIEERRQLEALVLSISEREQQRIGQDLHDGLCQQLTGIKFRNRLLEQKLAERGAAEAEDARALETLLSQAVEQARSQARGLNPVRLEAEGLRTALEELAVAISGVFGIRCVCGFEGRVLVDDHAVAIHLYRIAQEAISNAIKHGKATTVRLQLTEQDGHISLAIHDDGVGLPATPSRNGGSGLHIMRYRARTIGAGLELLPGEGGGTRVTCRLPKPQPAAATRG